MKQQGNLRALAVQDDSTDLMNLCPRDTLYFVHNLTRFVTDSIDSNDI